VADGVIIPGDLYIQYLAGKFNDVPVIIGTNSDEGAGFVQPSQVLKPEGFEKIINENYGPAAKAILKIYPHAAEKETLKSQKDIWRESLFGWPAWAWANLHAKKSKNKTYVYYFDVHSDKSPDGAPHSAEVSYVLLFKYGINGGRPTESDKTVMDLMSSYWINFAKTGDPNSPGLPVWQTYDKKNMKAMIFDEASSARPLPNIEKYKAFDAYYAWRRKQNKEKD
jgi:para-nitrobenzyl esterase